MILITGGAGVMGSALVNRLSDSGNEVRVLTLPGDGGVSRIIRAGVDIRYGDVSIAENIKGLCEGVDTVFHLAAIIVTQDVSLYRKINVGGTENMVNEARWAGVGHFVHVSSASVVYPHPTPYSISKGECEKIVRDSGLDWTIIRPTLAFDRKGGQEFEMFLEYLNRFPVVPFIGRGGAKKRPVFVGDIVDGLAALHGNSKALGKIYNFSGGESISILDFSRLCLILMGKENKPFLHVPVWFCMILAALMRNMTKSPGLTWPVIAGITQDADLDPREAVEDIGYRPTRVSEKLPQCFPR